MGLRSKIKESGLEVMEDYPAKISENGKHLVGLEEFGTRVLNNLWNAITNLFPEPVYQTESSRFDKEYISQMTQCSRISGHFVGRDKLINQILSEVSQKRIIQLSGPSGVGVSSLLAKIANQLSHTKNKNFVVPFLQNVLTTTSCLLFLSSTITCLYFSVLITSTP